MSMVFSGANKSDLIRPANSSFSTALLVFLLVAPRLHHVGNAYDATGIQIHSVTAFQKDL